MPEDGREVLIQFFGPLRRPEGMRAGASRLVVPASETAEGLLERLGYDEAERSRLKVMDGRRPLKPTDRIGGLDAVTIFLPLGGG